MKKLEELDISPAPWHCVAGGVYPCGDWDECLCEWVRSDADARLITAAPKLYAVLWELIEACGEVGYKDGGTAACYESEHHLYDVIDRAKSALAEAAGETEVK